MDAEWEDECAAVYDRVLEGCGGMDAATLVRALTHRQDALARMEEHGMPRVILDRQEAIVSATRRALQDRGLL